MFILANLQRYKLIAVIVLLYATVADAAYDPPTENISRIARAIDVRHKSLTTLVTVARDIPLTQPVEISIGYYSPAGNAGNNRITQTYLRSTGNYFLYNDVFGDGLSRTMTLAITLSEKKPGGGVYNYSITRTLTLDPLYSFEISPMTFRLLSGCDSVGDNEIKLYWAYPDGKKYITSFSTPAGKDNVIDRFNWSAAEVSASRKLFLPKIDFEEIDSGFVNFGKKIIACDGLPICGFMTPLNTGIEGDWLPGKSGIFRKTVSERKDQCNAYYEYRFESKLLSYRSL